MKKLRQNKKATAKRKGCGKIKKATAKRKNRGKIKKTRQNKKAAAKEKSPSKMENLAQVLLYVRKIILQPLIIVSMSRW